jgi:hypothetical protein
VRGTSVLPEYPTLGVHDRAGASRNARVEERGPTAAGDEAHVHALGLVSGAQPERCRLRADLRLRELADRQEGARELVRPEHVQHVRLVLGPIRAAEQPRRASGAIDARMVAGGEVVEAEQACPLQQGAELDHAVALDTRVGCGALRVRAHIRIHHAVSKRRGVVEHVVGDPELGGDPACVLDVGHAATAGIGLAAPELQRDARDVVALAQQQSRGYGRVDSAAHGHEHGPARS